MDELERFQPTLGYMRLLKESVRRVWHDRKASVKNEVASAEHRAKAIQQKLGRLDDAFIYKESIDLGTYERQRDRLREELTLVESDRHGSKVEEFDVEAILNFAERVLPRASDLWIQASLEQGQRLQRLFFRKAWPSYLHGHSALSRASSRHSGGKERLPGSDPDLGHGSARLTRATCGPRFSRLRLQTHGPAGPRGRKGGQHSLVTRPRRLTGTSRRTPIGWPQRVPGVRRPHVTSGLLAPRPLCRSTSRQASVRETPNAEARDCVRRRRTSTSRRTVVTLSSEWRKSH